MLNWIDDDRFRIGDTQFRTFSVGSVVDPAGDELLMGKSRASSEEFAQILAEFQGGNIVEIGVYHGGSAAFVALLAEPRKLVTVDLNPAPTSALETFIARRGLRRSFATYWGVNQADRQRLQAIARDEFEQEPIDLVVDDASHRLIETRASFEVLFPLLRPGGLYLVEDWRWDIALHETVGRVLSDPGAPTFAATRERIASVLDDPSSYDHVGLTSMIERASRDPSVPWHAEAQALLVGRARSEEPRLRTRDPMSACDEWQPMARFIVEVLFAQACTDDVVRKVTVTQPWIAIRRGADALDPATFRLSDLVLDHFPLLRP